LISNTINFTEIKMYKFNGTAGDKIRLRAVMNGYYVDHAKYIEIRSPQGETLELISDHSSQKEKEFTLPTTGTYQIFLYNWENANYGFNLSLYKLDDLANIPEINYSDLISNTINFTEIKMYKFNGTAGDKIRLRAVMNGYYVDHAKYIEIRSPQGDTLVFISDHSSQKEK
jgi:hypothetical protein